MSILLRNELRRSASGGCPREYRKACPNLDLNPGRSKDDSVAGAWHIEAWIARGVYGDDPSQECGLCLAGAISSVAVLKAYPSSHQDEMKMKARRSAFGTEKGDEGHGQRLLLVRGLVGKFVEVLYVGKIAAVFSAYKRTLDPLVFIGKGAFIEVLRCAG